jgi:hypothetical protein
MRQIIDMHIHAYGGEGSVGSAFFGTEYVNPLTGDSLEASKDPNEHLEQTFAAFDQLGVVKAVVSPGTAQGVATFHKYDSRRVLRGYAMDDFDVSAAREAHAKGMIDVIGEVTLQYAGIAPDDPRVDAIFAFAEEIDVPIGYHMFPGGPPGRAAMGISKMRAVHGSPLLLEDGLERHPSVRLYVMHAAWPMISELLALLYAYPQVFIDLGVIAWCQPRQEFHHYLQRVIEAGYIERVMFGSDQMVWPQTIQMSVEAVEEAPFLSELQKQAIFHDNAASFLRI